MLLVQNRRRDQKKPNHQMLWTAPDGWVNLGGGIICSTIRKITCEKCPNSRIGEKVKKKKNPNHQMLWTAPDGWGNLWGGHNL